MKTSPAICRQNCHNIYNYTLYAKISHWDSWRPCMFRVLKVLRVGSVAFAVRLVFRVSLAEGHWGIWAQEPLIVSLRKDVAWGEIRSHGPMAGLCNILWIVQLCPQGPLAELLASCKSRAIGSGFAVDFPGSVMVYQAGKDTTWLGAVVASKPHHEAFGRYDFFKGQFKPVRQQGQPSWIFWHQGCLANMRVCPSQVLTFLFQVLASGSRTVQGPLQSHASPNIWYLPFGSALRSIWHSDPLCMF